MAHATYAGSNRLRQTLLLRATCYRGGVRTCRKQEMKVAKKEELGRRNTIQALCGFGNMRS